MFRGEEFAKKTLCGGLIAPPFLIVPIAFCVQEQVLVVGLELQKQSILAKIEFYEPIRVGNTITIKAKAYDKYIKRGKKYLTYLSEFRNQKRQLVAKLWLLLYSSFEEQRGA